MTDELKDEQSSEVGVSARSRSIRNRFLDTNLNWIIFTVALGVFALCFHLVVEYVLHLYDVTQIDTFTHWLSGMAVATAILNLNLSRSRKRYYGIAIASAYVFYILWEIAEGIYFYYKPLGMIQTEFWDALKDLWLDGVGALNACFLADEVIS